MNISSTNYQSNQPSFSAIMRQRTNYSKTQRKIFHQIYAGLDNYEPQKPTLAEEYENMGWDFILSPANKGRILLRAVKNAKFINGELHLNSKSKDINIGSYGIDNPFNVNDVRTALDKNKWSKLRDFFSFNQKSKSDLTA